MDRADLSFLPIGHGASLGLVDGNVVGVLYFTEDAEDAWETGEPEDTFVWFWVPIGSPSNHEGLRSPPLRGAMTEEQAQANREVAMEDTFRLLSGVDSGS